jgi:hypothetical protein
MDEIRLDAGLSGLYTGTRTAAQGRVLARAEETIAAWLALTRPAVLRALGLHAPLDQETSTEIRELAASLRDDADRLLTLVGGTVETAETVGGALPLLITGTFEPGTLTIPPSEKLWNLDERDDRPAGVYP